MQTRVACRLIAHLILVALLAAVALPAKRVSGAMQRVDAPVIARVTMRDNQELRKFITLGLDLLEMRKGDDLFILTTAAEAARLASEGWAISVDEEQTAMLREQGPETFQGGYRTVTEIRALFDQAETDHPDLADLFVYGSSWEKISSGGAGGHDLFGIRLTNRLKPGPKPTFFLMAAIHARELATTELAARFVTHLLNGYGTDGDATWLLDEHEIIVIPISNPDGRRLAEQGYYQRKNTNTTYGGGCPVPPTPFDQFGVDLNRNSHFKWGTVNPPTEPRCGQTYPGPSAASEPEISALETLVRSIFPDQRGPLDTDPAPTTTTGFFLTLHSYSNLVLWPWGWTETAAPNAIDLATIGQKFASYNGYTPQQSTDLYPTSGTTDDWAYGELGVAAMTFEVGPSSGTCGGFFPAFSCLDGGSGGSFWPRNLPAFLYAARIARAPYLLGRGPTPETLTATVTTANNYQLQANLSEQFNGGQQIVAAEYYIDTPPWRGGSGVAMAAADGSFNSATETAVAQVGPLSGRHLFYVRGKDSLGNWGPVKAVFTPGQPCVGTLSKTGQAFSAAGGAGSLGLASPVGCSWQAGTGADWIIVTSPKSGIGDTVVTFEVRENFDARPRAATIAVAGQVFTVRQAGVDTSGCSNSISPKLASFAASGGTGSINVLAAEVCLWTATASAGWISITSDDNGIGAGSVTYSVAANTTGSARTATITIGGRVFSVKQKGG
ncbi:MAG TPA: M14 family zinc carboxypeptidase [Blastocatellia bacterium]|nr:M14 family zinc carboxypeptidase [Blastocatellia bacterium]